MDLAQFDLKEAANSGISVDLAHPITGETLEDEKGKSISIKILGRDSAKWQQAQKRNTAKNANKYRNGKVPDAEVERQVRDLLAECTVSWSGIIYNEEVLKCSKENALMIYEKRSWIAEQMLEAAADRANYIFTQAGYLKIMFAIGLGSLRTRKALRRHELSLYLTQLCPTQRLFLMSQTYYRRLVRAKLHGRR